MASSLRFLGLPLLSVQRGCLRTNSFALFDDRKVVTHWCCSCCSLFGAGKVSRRIHPSLRRNAVIARDVGDPQPADCIDGHVRSHLSKSSRPAAGVALTSQHLITGLFPPVQHACDPCFQRRNMLTWYELGALKAPSQASALTAFLQVAAEPNSTHLARCAAQCRSDAAGPGATLAQHGRILRRIRVRLSSCLTRRSSIPTLALRNPRPSTSGFALRRESMCTAAQPARAPS